MTIKKNGNRYDIIDAYGNLLAYFYSYSVARNFILENRGQYDERQKTT